MKLFTSILPDDRENNFVCVCVCACVRSVTLECGVLTIGLCMELIYSSKCNNIALLLRSNGTGCGRSDDVGG